MSRRSFAKLFIANLVFLSALLPQPFIVLLTSNCLHKLMLLLTADLLASWTGLLTWRFIAIWSAHLQLPRWVHAFCVTSFIIEVIVVARIAWYFAEQVLLPQHFFWTF